MRSIKTNIVFAISLILLVFGSASPARNTGAEGNGTLRITVRDPNGAAVPGANVSVKKKDCRCSDCSPDQRPCKCCINQITTDDEGQATFTVSSGSYAVKVEVSGFKDLEQDDVEVRAGETKTLEISLNPGASVKFSGRVQDENNQPLQNVEILFAKIGCKCDSCSEKEKPCKCCFSQRAMSDASGNFSVGGLKSSDYDIRLIKDGQTAGSFNGLEVRQSEKVLFTITESKSRKP